MTTTPIIEKASMTQTPTPGPWQFRRYPQGTTIISTHPRVPGSMVMDRLKGVTVHVEGFVYDDQSNANELSADARLLVSAPELLEEASALWAAATEALANLEKHDPATSDAIRSEFSSALRRPAISKAKGAI